MPRRTWRRFCPRRGNLWLHGAMRNLSKTQISKRLLRHCMTWTNRHTPTHTNAGKKASNLSHPEPRRADMSCCRLSVLSRAGFTESRRRWRGVWRRKRSGARRRPWGRKRASTIQLGAGEKVQELPELRQPHPVSPCDRPHLADDHHQQHEDPHLVSSGGRRRAESLVRSALVHRC